MIQAGKTNMERCVWTGGPTVKVGEDWWRTANKNTLWDFLNQTER